MEALAALGLASNVVQFVQFVSELISTGTEIAGSVQGTSQRTLELEEVYKSLSDLSSRLHCGGNSRQNNDDTSGLRGLLVHRIDLSQRVELQSHIQSLERLAGDCNLLCEQLLGTIQKLRVQGTSYRPFKSFIAALKTAWNVKKIRDLEERIDQYQKTISLHFFPLLRYIDPARFTSPMLMLYLLANSSHTCSKH